MAPGNGGVTGTRSGRRGAYQYLAIDDFRPGIITDVRSRTAGTEGRFPLPRGAAKTALNCIATPTGQLTALSSVPTSPRSISYTPGGVSIPYIVGLISAGVNYFIGLQGDNGGAGPNYQQKAHLLAVQQNNLVAASSTRVSVNAFPQADQGSPTPMLHGMSFAFGRCRNANFTQPGNPSIFAEWAEYNAAITNGAALTRWVSPDPTNPSVNTFLQANTTVNNPTSNEIIQLSHNGRIIAFNNVSYQWGSLFDKFITNELISYTDPPGNYLLGSVDTVLDPVEPMGFGSWGALSYGELVIFKHQGGALQIMGDIYAPTIVRLPGVRSTHGLTSPAIQTARGLIYLVNYDGAYIWTGGLSSLKVSSVPDMFYGPPMAQGVHVTPTRWGNYVVYPGGWLFDDITGAWWRLNDTHVGESAAGAGDGSLVLSTPSGVPGSSDGVSLLAAPARMTDATHVGLYGFSGTVGGEYTWQSQPLMLLPERQVNVREFIIDVFRGNNARIQAWITNLSDSPIQIFDKTIVGAGMQRIRMPCGVTTLNPSVTITVTPGYGGGSTGTKVIVNQIVLGWEEGEPISQTVP